MHEVELTARVRAAGQLGDALLTALRDRVDDPAIVENVRQGTVGVACGVEAPSVEAAFTLARNAFVDSLRKLGAPEAELVALHAVTSEHLAQPA